jgi:hypothetical protein
MRKVLSIVLLGILPTLVSAGVYKWVDADGTVHFSDVPQEGAEEVHVAPPQTYEAPRLPPITPRPEVAAVPAAYTRFALVTPAAEENIWDNTGTIVVTFTVEPPLQTDSGHQLVVLVDGQARPAVPDSSVALENIDRGSHTLQGQIIDARGDVVMSSESITVHLHRQSLLSPQRAQPKPTPKPK